MALDKAALAAAAVDESAVIACVIALAMSSFCWGVIEPKAPPWALAC